MIFPTRVTCTPDSKNLIVNYTKNIKIDNLLTKEISFYKTVLSMFHAQGVMRLKVKRAMFSVF